MIYQGLRRFLILVLLAEGVAAPQRKSEELHAEHGDKAKFSTRANMVLVPVVVTDKSGQHVRGLTVDDFDVQEDGKRQKIAGLEEVTAEAGALPRPAFVPASFSNQVVPGHAKNVEIVLLDLLNTPVAGRAEAQRGLIDFLSKPTDDGPLLALLVLRSNGIYVIHDITNDPAILIEAIRKIKTPATSRDSPTINTNGGDTDAEVRQFAALGASGTAAEAGLPSRGSRHGFRAEEASVDIALQKQEAMITLQALQQIAQYYASVPGRKSLIWASTGFKLFFAGSIGERTLQMLQGANIAVYPVDVGGLTLGSQSDMTVHGKIPSLAPGAELIRPGSVADPYRMKHEIMDLVADTTGGRAYYNLNESDELFQRARQDSAQYYTLSYYTKDTGKYGWRKLSVHVRGKGMEVRARTGFFFTNAAVQDSTREAEEITALISPLESTSLPISGQWGQIETDDEKRKVHFTLSIPPVRDLIGAEHDDHLDIDFLVIAQNSAGARVAQIGQRLTRQLTPVEANQLTAQGISYENALTLPQGVYDIHIVVRDNLRGRIGSVITTLKVD